MWVFWSSAQKQDYLPIIETQETKNDGMITLRTTPERDQDTCEESKSSILRSPWTLHVIALICYSTILWSWHRGRHHEKCIEKHSLYSPALSVVSDSYRTVRWNISASTPSKFAGPPTASVDAAWKNFTDLGAMVLSHDDLVRINGSRYSARVPLQVGDGYIAHVEWYHQLHCVYMLWQQTYPEFYTEEKKMRESEPELWHEHLDHCAETLRASIMCHADANIVPSNWIRGRHWPHPNYNLDHKCRDFDAAYQWAVDNQANPPPGFELFSRPKEGGYSEFEDLPWDPFDEGKVVPVKEKAKGE